MIRVGVVGAAGRMGRAVCATLIDAPDTELVAAIDPASAGLPVADLLEGPAESADVLAVSGGLEALVEARAEVVVDFSVAGVARQTLLWCAEHGVHAVVGTSGLGAADLEQAAALFDASSANAVVAANFAIGAVLLMRFSELAAPLMTSAEIVEYHHGAKRDAPSGTSMATAERMAAARLAAGAGPLPADPTTDHTLASARGARGAGAIRIHSVRLDGLVAHQEVVFGALGQSLTIRHDSYDRHSFMPGVLLAVREVAGRPGLTLGLDPLLGI